MKKLVTLQIIILLVISSYAQDEEATTIKGVATTAFTGMDYVRLMTHKEFVQSPSNTFTAIIKSHSDSKTLWQGNICPADVNEVG